MRARGPTSATCRWSLLHYQLSLRRSLFQSLLDLRPFVVTFWVCACAGAGGQVLQLSPEGLQGITYVMIIQISASRR